MGAGGYPEHARIAATGLCRSPADRISLWLSLSRLLQLSFLLSLLGHRALVLWARTHDRSSAKVSAFSPWVGPRLPWWGRPRLPWWVRPRVPRRFRRRFRRWTRGRQRRRTSLKLKPSGESQKA